MSNERIGVGVVGCGAISRKYFEVIQRAPSLELAACCDLDRSKAEASAAKYEVPKVCSYEQMLGNSSVQMVLNLTIPKAHGEVALAAIEAGKHTYAEKPLALDREEGRRILAAAEAKGVRAGCAPDTFLGAGLQTARALIDEGAIGQVTGFTAFMLGRGHEHWHPNPEFYYEPGGGPLLDMGPYYVTALVNLLGAARRVAGFASTSQPVRTITHKDGEGNPGPKHGKQIEVQTPDHISALLEFEGGVSGPLVTSFATWPTPYERAWPITVFGTEGTMRVPDPNGFDGTVLVGLREGDGVFEEQAMRFPTGYERGVGLEDMAEAIQQGRPHRASAEQAMYVLDLMMGAFDASESGQAHVPTLDYQRPEPMPSESVLGVSAR